MKYIFFFLLLSTTLLAQRGGEVKSDSIRLYLDTTECNTIVWFAETYVEYRGGKKNISYQIVGGSESDPCYGISANDTLGLIQAISNGAIEYDGKTRPGLLDYGRKQAQIAQEFIFQSKALRSYEKQNKALINVGMPGLFKKIEAMFADSLVGDYILVRPGVANANVTVTKTNQGAVRIRVNSQTNFPLVVYSDGFMTARNIAGTNQDVDLYKIEKGRWVSLIGSYQLVKQARQVVQRGVK